MMSKVFLDTNILVNAADNSDTEKKEQSRALLTSFLNDGVICAVSTQVLQEFYVVATRKLGIEPLMAKDMVHSFRNYEVVRVVPDLIEDAIDISILNQLSFWDALIVAAAESARCENILTEDLNHGQVIRGVRVKNPFVR